MLGKSLRVCDRPSKRQENQKIQRVILSKPPLHPYFPKDPLSSIEVTFRRTCTSGYWMLSFNKIVRTPLSTPKLRHTSSPLRSALTQYNTTLVPEKKKTNDKYTNNVFVWLTALGAYYIFGPWGWALIWGGRLFEAGRLLNFRHFQQV